MRLKEVRQQERAEKIRRVDGVDAFVGGVLIGWSMRYPCVVDEDVESFAA